MLPSLFIIALASAAQVAGLTYSGVDWSSLLVEEAAGRTYKNTAGTTRPLETILKASGVNTVRQRLWVNPSDGNYNLAYNVKLAKRAKAAGLNIYLDLHYRDTWADKAKQGKPAAWPSDIDNLAQKIYDYTKTVCNTFQSNGLSISIIAIGNEITNGLLWPLGTISNPYNIARLLHSASAGVKDSTLSTKPRIMIHLDNGWNWSTQKWWYDLILGQGPLLKSDFDIQGVSFYPFYGSGATLSALKSSLTNMASRYGKTIVVAEVNWPLSCSSNSNFPSDVKSVPFSAKGQVTFIKDVVSIVLGVHGGAGVFYWEPTWIDNAGLGSSCASNLMVDSSGKALSSLSVFGQI